MLSSARRRQGMFKVIRCPAELPECLSVLESDPADVVLMANGVTHNRQQLYELIRGVHSACPQAASVLLMDSFDRELVVNAIRAGAQGLFCLASSPCVGASLAFIRDSSGQTRADAILGRRVVRWTADTFRQLAGTARAYAVNLVAEGLNNRGIAAELG